MDCLDEVTDDCDQLSFAWSRLLKSMLAVYKDRLLCKVPIDFAAVDMFHELAWNRHRRYWTIVSSISEVAFLEHRCYVSRCPVHRNLSLCQNQVASTHVQFLSPQTLAASVRVRHSLLLYAIGFTSVSQPLRLIENFLYGWKVPVWLWFWCCSDGVKLRQTVDLTDFI